MHWIVQIIFVVMGAFLSLILTKLFIQNGKMVQRLESRLDAGLRGLNNTLSSLNETLKRIDERTAKIAELIVADGEKTRELIKSLRV
jgi:predicted PurR-regulated permease PerM